ncbi:Stp1/IreP family PP2C-type Ser/Thr phosphatase [Thermodesulfobacteriota bacterium]
MRVGYKTCVGKKRKVNQDGLLVDQELGLFIVADGMGGHNAGEVASSIAVKVVSETVRDGLKLDTDISTLLEESVQRAHRSIFDDSMKHHDRRDMGTTVTVALVQGDYVRICHVGDSRAYLVANGRIEALTKDHTFVGDWVAEGRITPEEARTHPARHGLTMALGVDDDVEPEVGKVAWHNGQCLLLCSDGLTEILEDSTILEIIESSGDPDVACKELVAQTRNRGGDDDITVILVCR